MRRERDVHLAAVLWVGGAREDAPLHQGRHATAELPLVEAKDLDKGAQRERRVVTDDGDDAPFNLRQAQLLAIEQVRATTQQRRQRQQAIGSERLAGASNAPAGLGWKDKLTHALSILH